VRCVCDDMLIRDNFGPVRLVAREDRGCPLRRDAPRSRHDCACRSGQTSATRLDGFLWPMFVADEQGGPCAVSAMTCSSATTSDVCGSWLGRSEVVRFDRMVHRTRRDCACRSGQTPATRLDGFLWPMFVADEQGGPSAVSAVTCSSATTSDVCGSWHGRTEVVRFGRMVHRTRHDWACRSGQTPATRQADRPRPQRTRFRAQCCFE
jgi:hypothetical protein